MDTGKRIAELRRLAGLSQETLAGRLNVSRSLVAKWENGSRRPDSQSLEALAKLFCVSEESIVEISVSVLEELSSCIPAGFDPSRGQLNMLLNGFLSTLGGTERIVFLRRYHFFDRPSEIAERYGMSKGYVRIVLFRARKKLKEYLSGQGGGK